MGCEVNVDPAESNTLSLAGGERPNAAERDQTQSPSL